MSRDRQQYRVELGADADDATQELSSGAGPGTETPFRIALLGDFSGRASRGVGETGEALSARRPVRVDRDNVDDAIARLGPQLRLSIGHDSVNLRFTELDDFSPDRLYERLPAFRALRETRERAAAPAPVADIGRQGGRASTGRSGPSATSLLDEILGDVPPPPGGAAATSRAEPVRAVQGDPLSDFVRRAVAPHVVPATAPAQPERVEEIDQIVTADLRTVLHHRDMQALEAAWRSVDFLVRRLETDSMLQVYLLDVSKAELAADLSSAEVTQTRTHKLLVDSSVGMPGEAPWGLLVGLYAFGTDADDLELLGRIAAIARAATAPFVAGADSRVVGSPSFGAVPDPEDWILDEVPAWQALRRSPDARYLGLAAPRFLLRLPYGGPDGTPCDVPEFEELSTPTAHDEYLWGNSAVLCALLFGEAFALEGWSLRPRLDVPGLPFHLIRAGGEVTAKPCAEALLTARAVGRLLDRGVMAVQSMKDVDAVRLARIQSVAEPLAALPVGIGRG